MSTAAVLAHFDPAGEVGPHVIRHLSELAEVANRVVIVTTARLTDMARTQLQSKGELVERQNEGYDFCSWKAGLDELGDWWALERVILANDSVVGPLVPYHKIITAMANQSAPFWGITCSREFETHIQSYVLGFERPALAAPLLRAFWKGVVPLSSRQDVIARYERGLSRLMTLAGLSGSSYYRAGRRDERIARQRRARAAYRNTKSNAAHAGAGITPTRSLLAVRSAKFLLPNAAYNPMIALWDRAIPGDLPFVKLETLRDDPYQLDSRRKMLTRLERQWPGAFAGVREYIERTEAAYADLGRGRVGVTGSA